MTERSSFSAVGCHFLMVFYSGEIKGALKAIPSISIVTDPDNLFDSSIGIYVNASDQNDDDAGEDWERKTSIELIDPNGAEGFHINGGIRIRGASSTSSGNPKHSFRFFFRSEYGASRLNYKLFGDEGADSDDFDAVKADADTETYNRLTTRKAGALGAP